MPRLFPDTCGALNPESKVGFFWMTTYSALINSLALTPPWISLTWPNIRLSSFMHSNWIFDLSCFPSQVFLSSATAQSKVQPLRAAAHSRRSFKNNLNLGSRNHLTAVFLSTPAACAASSTSPLAKNSFKNLNCFLVMGMIFSPQETTMR